MVLPYVHIATAVVALNAAASFSVPIIRREVPLPGSTSSPGQISSLNHYVSMSGPHSPLLSPASSSSGSLYPQSSSHSSHSQSSQNSFSDGPLPHLWEDMHKQSSPTPSGSPSPHSQSSLHDEDSWEAMKRRIMAENRSGPSSPIRTPPKVRFAEELNTYSSPSRSPKSPKTPSMSRWQRVKGHSVPIAVGVGLASVAGLVALGATSRRDIDEREDLLYGRALMFNLDKLD